MSSSSSLAFSASTATSTTSTTTTATTTTFTSTTSTTSKTTTTTVTTVPVALPATSDCNILTSAYNFLQYSFQCKSGINGKFIVTSPYSKRDLEERQTTTASYVIFANERITDIVLNNLGLNILPPSFAKLTNLTTFNVANNKISGSIPKAYGQLTNLVTVDFSGNSLSGYIPGQFASLKKLKTLNLAGNALSGQLPASILAVLTANGGTYTWGVQSVKTPNCRAISLDTGYLGPQWAVYWQAWQNVGGDLNAFDNAAQASNYFGTRAYFYQSFRKYAKERVWCMKYRPDYVYAAV